MQDKKAIAVIGSTGSIGRQTLDVISQHEDKFSVEVLTANSQADLLVEQALRFNPNCVVIADKSLYPKVRDALSDTYIKVFAGSESIDDAVQMESVDVVVTAIVGFAGLSPTVKAIRKGKIIALSNKETLVVAGEHITALAAQYNVPILPIDSEHSAIFQSINGEYCNKIKRIYLTASGGPFRTKTQSELEKVSVREALNHPNWSMGKKVSVDSASLMNKGLEMIEARWLFGVSPSQIEAVIHPQSVIHSMVEFEDGCLKAQLGIADMRLPIQYALTYPQRMTNNSEPFDIYKYGSLTFEQPNRRLFPCLDLAYRAIEHGGNMPAILNAANEVAVNAFIKGYIRFVDIPYVIEKSLSDFHFIQKPSLDDLFETDDTVRRTLENKITELTK